MDNATIPPGLGFDREEHQEEDKWDSAKYEALLKGGEQVTSVMEEMIKLVSASFLYSHFIKPLASRRQVGLVYLITTEEKKDPPNDQSK